MDALQEEIQRFKATTVDRWSSMTWKIMTVVFALMGVHILVIIIEKIIAIYFVLQDCACG